MNNNTTNTNKSSNTGLLAIAGILGAQQALSKQDKTNNLLESNQEVNALQITILDSILMYSKLLYANISFIADAIAEANMLAMQDLKIKEDQIRKEQLLRASADPEKKVTPKLFKETQEDKGPIGGLIGQLLGFLKGVVIGGIALILGSEVWLYLRGLTDGTEAKRLLRDVQAFGAKLWLFGGLVAKLAAPIARFIPLGRRLLRVIPGLGQAITIITGLFTGFTAGFESFKAYGDWKRAIIDGITAGLEGIVNAFVDILGLIGVPDDKVQAIKDAVSAFFGGLNYAMRGLLDILTTSEIEAVKDAAIVERRMAERRLRQSRRDGNLTDAQRAQLEADVADARRKEAAARYRAELEDLGADMETLTMEYLLTGTNMEDLQNSLKTGEMITRPVTGPGFGVAAMPQMVQVERPMAREDQRAILAERGLLREQARARAFETSTGSASGLPEAQDLADKETTQNNIVISSPTSNSSSTQINTNIRNNGQGVTPLTTKDDALAPF